MKYKNIKVSEINLSVYLGDEFKNKDWRENQKVFGDKIKDLKFKVGFRYECPIEDLISVQVDYEDSLELIAKEDTIDKIFSVTNELLKIFVDNVKINLYLDGYIDGEGNSIDLNIKEFTEWLSEELAEYEE